MGKCGHILCCQLPSGHFFWLILCHDIVITMANRPAKYAGYVIFCCGEKLENLLEKSQKKLFFSHKNCYSTMSACRTNECLAPVCRFS